jgi:hypothetical protein
MFKEHNQQMSAVSWFVVIFHYSRSNIVLKVCLLSLQLLSLLFSSSGLQILV